MTRDKSLQKLTHIL